MKMVKNSLVAILLVASLFGALLVVAPHAGALDNTFFDSSDTYNHATGGTVGVKLRVGNSANVKKANTYAAAYFTSPTGNTITIKNINYCDGNSYDDFAESASGYKGIGKGDNVTTYQITGHAGNIYGVKGQGCETDLTIALGTLPLDPATGFYKADFKALYMANNAGVVGNYFKLVATAPAGERAYISQLAAPDNNAFGNAVTFRKFNNTDNLTNYIIRFGADCTVPASGEINSVNYYDLDNSTAAPQNAGTYITMSLQRINKSNSSDTQYWHANATLTGGSWANSSDTWKPANGNNISGSTKGIRFDRQYSYIWVMHNVRTNNTIQFSTPYDGIYYLKNANSCNWQLNATSLAQNVTKSINGPIGGTVNAAPNDTIQFVHTIKNAGTYKSDPYTTREQFTNTAGAKSATLCAASVTASGPPPPLTACQPTTGTQNNGSLAAGASKQFVPASATRFTIPANAVNGTTYCQMIGVNPTSFLNDGWLYSTRACVVVTSAAPAACTASQQPAILASKESGGSLQLAITGMPDGPVTVRVTGYGAGGSNLTLTGNISAGKVTLALPTADHAGRFAVAITSPTPMDCGNVNVYDLPFFTVTGASIRAGGDFNGGSCTGGGTIAGWYNNETGGNGFGSSTNMATIGLLNIVGVASYQSVRSHSPTGATFANNVLSNITSDAHSPKLGGAYGATQYCQPLPQKPSNAVTYNAGSVNANAVVGAIAHNGDLQITGGTIPTSQNGAVFVSNGDVYISGSGILYQTGWTSANAIPSFVVVVNGGNIYIDKNITQLDGNYVARKVGSSGGHIYTCAEGNGALVGETDLYALCNNRLIIHGSFNANKVDLMRTGGTLQDGLNANPVICTHTAPAYKKSCAAEVFDYSPEVYLSTPAVRPQSNGSLHYDSIVSLPPIL